MNKEKHRKITEFFADSFGGKGFSSVAEALIILFGISLVVAGIKAPGPSQTAQYFNLVIMMFGVTIFTSGFIYGKVSDKTKLGIPWKIYSAFVTLYLYSVGFLELIMVI